MFRMLFALIIRSTTAAYSRRFCVVWCVYSIGVGTESVTDRAKVLKCPKTSTCSNWTNTPNHTNPMAVRCSCVPDDGCKLHPKHVELSCQERNKEYSTSSWTWIKHTYISIFCFANDISCIARSAWYAGVLLQVNTEHSNKEHTDLRNRHC
jgi:hypothetical protein